MQCGPEDSKCHFESQLLVLWDFKKNIRYLVSLGKGGLLQLRCHIVSIITQAESQSHLTCTIYKLNSVQSYIMFKIY